MTDDYRRKGLPIDEYGIDMEQVELGSNPETGLYYLCQVRKEADTLSNVVIASNRDTLVVSQRQNVPDHLNMRLKYFGIREAVVENLQIELPSMRWIDFFLREFQTQRTHIQDYLEYLKKTNQNRRFVYRPYHSDAKNWKKMCYGYQEQVFRPDTKEINSDTSHFAEAVSEQPETSETIFEDEDILQDIQELINTSKKKLAIEKHQQDAEQGKSNPKPKSSQIPPSGHLPTLKLIETFGQKNIISLLSHHTAFLSETCISQRQCEWILALLLVVTDVLTSDELSGLRGLCRKCRIIRNNIWNTDSYTADIVALNLIIAIISRIFRQADLGDVYPE